METSLAFILAGGSGSRLTPLTDDRAKPAVPFSRYRVIDHNLSAIINAGIPKIFLLPQYKPISLDLHIDRAYPHTDIHLEKIVSMVYPRQIRTLRGVTEYAWYEGTAHAVKQNTQLIDRYSPDHVLIFAGDHICAINVAEMLEHHHREKRDLTIGVEERLLSEDDFEINSEDKQLYYKYGVFDVDSADRVLGFREKPLRTEMGEPGTLVLVSMGNYIFHTDPLTGALEEVTEEFNDFGRNVIPSMLRRNMDLFVYRFKDYWRDVGDIVSYFNACMDLNQESPPLNYKQLKKEKRPITTEGGDLTPSRFICQGRISTIAEGCEVYGTIENCVLGQNVYVGQGSIVRNSVLFPGVVIEEGVNIQSAIIDKNNVIPRGVTIGYDIDSDSLRSVCPNPNKPDELKPYVLVRRNGDFYTVVPRVEMHRRLR